MAPPVAHRLPFGVLAALALVVPALGARVVGAEPAAVAAALLYGLGVVGAAFLLAWAAEALQVDVSAGLALTLVALIAVLPEYAVDFVFTWQAGEDPRRAPLALANMTGGNRLLIGIGWSMVVVLAAARVRRAARRRGDPGRVDTAIELERSQAVGLAFLAAATLYALTLPFKHRITLVDTVVFVGLFVAYLVRIARAPVEEPALVGPARLLGALPATTRRIVLAGMFVVAAGVIGVCAEPFASSLVRTGAELGVDQFLLIQWLAPLASEAPELVVAAVFAWRLNTNNALGTLVSAQFNQWALLVGTLPVVFAVSSASWQGLPITGVQREELLLTAAQSAFAFALIADRRLSVREGGILLGLFLTQFVLGGVLPGEWRGPFRVAMAAAYLAAAAGLLVGRRRAVRRLLRDGFREPAAVLAREEPA